MVLFLYRPIFSQDENAKQFITHTYRKDVNVNLESFTILENWGVEKPEQIAIRFITLNKYKLGISDTSEIKLLGCISSPAGNHISFQQYYHGIKVWNSVIVVSINKNKAISMVINGFKPNISIPLTSNLTKESILQIAKDQFLDDTLYTQTPHTPELFVYEDSLGIFHFVWQTYIYPLKRRGAWRIIVDAGTGNVLDIENSRAFNNKYQSMQNNRLSQKIDSFYIFNKYNSSYTQKCLLFNNQPYTLYVNGYGRVWDPDPVTKLQNSNLNDQNNANYFVNSDYAIRELFDLNEADNNGDYMLRGKYVYSDHFIDITPNLNPQLAKESDPNEFKYFRDDEKFEEVNVYYHIDKQRRYIGSLGFSPSWNGETYIRYDAHVNENEDGGSYYDESTYNNKRIIFNDGEIDDAEDQDVIIHEYGHALHDVLLNTGQGGLAGKNLSTAGISEGIGFYLAVSYRKKLSLYDQDHIYPWDSRGYQASGLPQIYLSDSYKYPVDWNPPGSYSKGKLWASTLMDLEENINIGGNVTTKLVLTSVSLLTNQANEHDNIDAILISDRDISEYKAGHLYDLGKIFENRGYFTNRHISGNIIANDTWASHKFINGDTYINTGTTITVPTNSFLFINDNTKLVIESGATLNIQPGATVVLYDGASIEINVGGNLINNSLIANNETIFLLSSGCGINVRGNVTIQNPASGPTLFRSAQAGTKWNGIIFDGYGSRNSWLQYCTIEGAIKGIDFRGLIGLSRNELMIDNCTFQNCDWGIYSDHSQPTIKNCNISGCYTGIFVMSDSPFLENNTVSECGFGLWGHWMSTEVWNNKFKQNQYGAFLMNCGNVWYDNKCDFNNSIGLVAFQLVTNDYNRATAPDPPNNGNGMRQNGLYGVGVLADNFSELWFNGYNSVHSNGGCDLVVDDDPTFDSHIYGYNNYYQGILCTTPYVLWDLPYSTPPDPVEYNFTGQALNFSNFTDQELIDYAQQKRFSGEYSFAIQSLKILSGRGLQIPLAVRGAILWYKILNDASFNAPNNDPISTNIEAAKDDFYDHMITNIPLNGKPGRRYHQLAASMKAYSKKYGEAVQLLDPLIQNAATDKEKLQYLFDKFACELFGKKNKANAEAIYQIINNINSSSRHAVVARWLLGLPVSKTDWYNAFGYPKNPSPPIIQDSKESISVNDFTLFQNYPNPFGTATLSGNPVTNITFNVSSNSHVKIILLDALGREVRTLIEDEYSSGIHSVNFDGSSLTSGVYFYKMIAGKYSSVKKMTVIK